MTTWTEKFAEYEPFLDDIKRRIRFVVIFFILVFIVGFLVTAPLFKIAKQHLVFPGVQVVTASPFQFMDVSANVGFTLALVLTLPLLTYHIYDFLKEALTIREKKLFWVYIPLAVFLFALGFIYGFFILYTTFGTIAGINTSIGLVNYWDISRFLSEIFITSALLGVLFEFPIVLTVLIRLNLLEVGYLRTKRREAIVIIVVFTSLLPPTDAVSLILMSLPLVALYECSIWFNRKHAHLVEVIR